MTAPDTACTREGCGHPDRWHSLYGDQECMGFPLGTSRENRAACDCPAYQPAPTPTADACGACGRTMEAHLLDKGAICGGFYAPLPRDPKAWADDAAPSPDERIAQLERAVLTWQEYGRNRLTDATEQKDRADAAEERARTAEAEVKRLRAHSCTLNRIGWVTAVALGDAHDYETRHVGDPREQVDRLIGERDAARAEATATREAVERVRALADEWDGADNEITQGWVDDIRRALDGGTDGD